MNNPVVTNLPEHGSVSNYSQAFIAVHSEFEDIVFNETEKFSFIPPHKSLYYSREVEKAMIDNGLDQRGRTLQFYYKITRPGLDSFNIVPLDPVEIFKQSWHLNVRKEVCIQKGGFYSTLTQECVFYEVLSEICIKVNQDGPAWADEWVANKTWGNYGCFGEDFQIANYDQVFLFPGEIERNELPKNFNLTFSLRNGKDPIFTAEVMTHNTFHLGMESK